MHKEVSVYSNPASDTLSGKLSRDGGQQSKTHLFPAFPVTSQNP
jgi:hypothetical protein